MPEPTAWEDRISYLLAAVGAHVQQRFAALVAPTGLAPAHVGVLRRLAAHEASTQQEVADALRVCRSVMVGLLDDLEGRGLVERRRHPVDRRANALHLTASGRRVLAQLARATDVLDAELADAVPAGDLPELRSRLRRLAVATGVADGVYPAPPESRHDPGARRAAVPRSRRPA